MDEVESDNILLIKLSDLPCWEKKSHSFAVRPGDESRKESVFGCSRNRGWDYYKDKRKKGRGKKKYRRLILEEAAREEAASRYFLDDYLEERRLDFN